MVKLVNYSISKNMLIFLLMIPLVLSMMIVPSQQASATYDKTQICRTGFVLIHHNTFGNICVSESTAKEFVTNNMAQMISSSTTSSPATPSQESSTTSSPATPSQESTTTQTSQGNIQLPPYPIEPNVNPDFLNHTSNFYPPSVVKITDGVYDAIGYGMANSIMVVGNDGIIIIDTLGSYDTAKQVMKEFRKITDKPVKAIIYTHSHPDHINGAGAFAEEGGKDLQVYAQSGFMKNYYHESGEIGKLIATRGAYYYGAFLPKDGPDRMVNVGIGPFVELGRSSFVPPTKTFDDKLDIQVSGVNMTLISVPSETNDELVVWIPEKKVLEGAEVIYKLSPNLYSIRGTSYRDVKTWISSLDTMLDLKAEYLVPSHTIPVYGADNVTGVLTAYHDSVQYIYDQTIRGINQGKTADELAHSIDLPASLKNNPWLQERYGERAWHIKGIFDGNVGWFNGDAAFLNPVSDNERASKIVDGFGGVDKTLLAVRNAMADNQYEWAAELATYVIQSSPDNQEAKLLKAESLRVLGHRAHTSGTRDWDLTEALVLEGKIKIDTSSIPVGDPSQIAVTPVKILLEQTPTRLDPQKAEGVDMIVALNVTDINEQYYFHVRNDVAAFKQGIPDKADVTITTDAASIRQVFSAQKTVSELINSGAIKTSGIQDDFNTFISMFDPFVVTSSSPD